MTSEVIINVVLLQLGRVMMIVTHLNPKWGAFQIPTLLSRDLALKALCLVSSFSFLVSYFDFVPVSFFCVLVSWIPLSSPALLGFLNKPALWLSFPVTTSPVTQTQYISYCVASTSIHYWELMKVSEDVMGSWLIP